MVANIATTALGAIVFRDGWLVVLTGINVFLFLAE